MTLFIDLHRLRSTFHSTSIGSRCFNVEDNRYDFLGPRTTGGGPWENSGRGPLTSRSNIQTMVHLHVTPQIPLSYHLSIHLSISLFMHCQFFCHSIWLCACYSICPSLCLSISPVSVHLMSNLSVHCYCICLSFYHSVSCTFVGLAVSLSACLLILKAGMHNREAEMTVHPSSPEK